MSSEYNISISAGYGGADLPLLQQAFALVKERCPPYKIELAFERFGSEVETQLSHILDKYADLFFSLSHFEVSAEKVVFGWKGYGYGEWFLEDMLLLLQLMCLTVTEGRAVGDEGLYLCRMVGSGVECEYIEE